MLWAKPSQAKPSQASLLGSTLPVEAAQGIAQHKAQLQRAVDAARAEDEDAPAIRQGAGCTVRCTPQ